MDKSKQDNLTILLIADNFDSQLQPLVTDCPWALQRFSSKTILDLAFEWISQVDVPHIIVVSSSVETKVLEEYKNKWEDCFKSFLVLHLPNRMSVGDIMRDIDGKSLLSGDFILIDNPATVCTSNLAAQLANFKKLRQKNKNNTMSLLYAQRELDSCQTIGFHADTGKLVLYNSRDDVTQTSLVKSLFKKESSVRSDLAHTGITFCALEVLPMFSDNFDFNDLDDVIRDILINEEIHLKNIYIEALPEDKVAYVAYDYNSLLNLHRLVIQRWCFPLVFNFMNIGRGRPRLDHFMEQNVYASRGSAWPRTARNTVFGTKCQVAEDALLENSSFGDQIVIGPSSSLDNVIAGNNLRIGKNCQLHESIIGDNVVLEDECQIRRCCFIGSNVKIPSNTTIPSYSIIMCHPPSEDDEDTIRHEKENSYYKWFSTSNPRGRFWPSHRRGLSPTRSRSRERSRTMSGMIIIVFKELLGRARRDSDLGPSGPLDVIYGSENTNEIFASEVRESMNSVLESDSHAAEEHVRKLILEINSSKLAYNISMENVAKYVFASFLALPQVQSGMKEFKQLFDDWAVLWSNYYKPHASQTQMLHALEERLTIDDPIFIKRTPLIVKFLYDEALDDEGVIDEDVILNWYDNLHNDSPLKDKLSQLIDWLRNTNDDEDSDDDDSDKEN